MYSQDVSRSTTTAKAHRRASECQAMLSSERQKTCIPSSTCFSRGFTWSNSEIAGHGRMSIMNFRIPIGSCHLDTPS